MHTQTVTRLSLVSMLSLPSQGTDLYHYHVAQTWLPVPTALWLLPFTPSPPVVSIPNLVFLCLVRVEQLRSWVPQLWSVFACKEIWFLSPQGPGTFHPISVKCAIFVTQSHWKNTTWKADYTGQKHFTASAFARRQHVAKAWKGGKFKHICSYGEKKNPGTHSKKHSLPSKVPHFSLSFYTSMHQPTNFITVYQLQTTSILESLLLF